MDEPQTRMTDELEAIAQIIWEASHQGGVWKARMSWYRTSPEEQERSIRERGTHPDCFTDNRDVEQAFAAAKAILARTRSVEPPMVERLDGMIGLIVEWLAVNAPFCRTEQAHTTEGSRERAYWHHGYLMALRDAKRNLFEKETRQ